MTETINNSSSQSMKTLTEKVLKADLASRKKRMISAKAGKLSVLLMLPFVYYSIKVILIYYN